MRSRLPSLLRQPPAAVLILSLLAIAANQFGFDLFYGATFYLGSLAVVLALLLLGRPGVLVGLASVLLVPRLWADPQSAIVLVAEVLWLAAYLERGAGNADRRERGTDDVDRRERGDVVPADVLFWILVAIPLDFLLLGVIANLDLPSVVDLSLLQAINGVFNASLAYGLFMLIRISQSSRDPGRSFSLQGLILITLLGLTLLSGLLTLVVSIRQIDRDVIDDQLARFRQHASASAVLSRDALDDLSDLRHRQDSPLDFQVFDAGGRLLYTSNSTLFETLEARYVEPAVPAPHQLQVAEPLDLLIPLDSGETSLSRLRGYWRYETRDDQQTSVIESTSSGPSRVVVVVEPARSGMRELQSQASRGIRLLSLIVLLSVFSSRAIAKFLLRQFPQLPASQGLRAIDERFPASPCLVPPFAATDSNRLHSGLRELQPLLKALRSRSDVLISLQESYRRSECQRQRLELEVGRLNTIDPLTGCFNRRELYRRLDHELRLSGREQRELSFLSLEIDHLRHIEDSYGQSVAEEVLRRVALELRSRMRATDFLCRLGHEQFGLLLTACDTESASRVGALLSEAIRALEIRHEGAILAVTISVGVAAPQPARDDPDSLITRAQSALYRAKVEGRDRVVVA